MTQDTRLELPARVSSPVFPTLSRTLVSKDQRQPSNGSGPPTLHRRDRDAKQSRLVPVKAGMLGLEGSESAEGWTLRTQPDPRSLCLIRPGAMPIRTYLTLLTSRLQSLDEILTSSRLFTTFLSRPRHAAHYTPNSCSPPLCLSGLCHPNHSAPVVILPRVQCLPTRPVRQPA